MISSCFPEDGGVAWELLGMDGSVLGTGMAVSWVAARRESTRAFMDQLARGASGVDFARVRGARRLGGRWGR